MSTSDPAPSATMRAMVLERPGYPLVEQTLPVPSPDTGQILLRVRACAVCRTDLHLVDSELPDPRLPIIPGHEIVGEVAATGPGVSSFKPGDRAGVPWLGWACSTCNYCASGRENLCDSARFMGYTLDGGYAEYVVAYARYCLPIPGPYSDTSAAPLLCAGLIGYRCLKKAGDAQQLGIYGFGAAAHIIAQIAIQQGRTVYAFTRPGDTRAQGFARELGAAWTGGSDQLPPDPLDAAIIFAPVGALVPAALRSVRRGGIVICGGIHMTDIPAFPYDLLWGERTVTSVANLTRADGAEFMALTSAVPVKIEAEAYPLAQANETLRRLRAGEIKGAAVLVP